jgi:TrmH family RNA methyltransferase
MIIESSTNETFRRLKSLTTTRGLRKEGCFLLSGAKVINEALHANLVQQLVFAANDQENLAKLSKPLARKPIVLANSLFKELDTFGTGSPLAICTTPEIPTWAPDQRPSGTQVVLALQDPGNLGTALRSCAAFGVRDVIILKECAHPFHPKSIRASSGAFLSLKFYSGPSIRDLGEDTQQLVALDMTGMPPRSFPWPKDFYLLLGEEGAGVPTNLNAQRVSIPIARDHAESLNAATALAIALYELRTQQT